MNAVGIVGEHGAIGGFATDGIRPPQKGKGERMRILAAQPRPDRPTDGLFHLRMRNVRAIQAPSCPQMDDLFNPNLS